MAAGFGASFFNRLVGSEQRSTLKNPDAALYAAFAGTPTYTGRAMDENSALTLPAVWACVNLIAQTVGSLPMNVYRKSGDQRIAADDTRLGRLLGNEANAEMSAGELWEIVVRHLLLWGNAYLYKERVNGVVAALLPLLPSRVRPDRDQNGNKVFVVQNGGNTLELAAREVIHIRNASVDGFVGLSPIQQMRQALGVYSAHEEYEGRFYGNNATPSGILNIPPERTLDEEGAKKLRSQWEALQGGLSNAGRVAVLRDGVTFESISIPFGDQQFIEQKRFSVQEVCRIYGVPAWMLGESTGNSLTYANVEQQLDFFMSVSVRHWLARIERELDRDGDLTGDPNLYARFDMDDFVRADLKTRYEAYNLGITNGWLLKNEVRVEEDRNPIEGLDDADTNSTPPPA